jgi:hypothetical protein
MKKNKKNYNSSNKSKNNNKQINFKIKIMYKKMFIQNAIEKFRNSKNRTIMLGKVKILSSRNNISNTNNSHK